MGILDEAIREHLELKRQHGADDSELKQLEDDAFGPPQRPGAEQEAPDPAAEAATEFMAQPDLGESGAQAVPEAEAPEAPSSARREPIADVQEPPAPVEEPEPDEQEPEAGVEPEEKAEAKVEAPPLDEEDDGPDEEQQPAGEHEAVTPPPASHSTEERHVIADQPTEMFDVEKEFSSAEAPAPSDDELVAEESSEPRLGPVEPLAPEDEQDEDDDFFDEQRLSEELDQALEAPLDPDSEELEQPASEEFESEEIERPAPAGEQVEPESEEAERPPAARSGDEDVLEETPDFLEEAPEDDQLWFEQKPPKDFDFDD
jgi:hypothetical protein